MTAVITQPEQVTPAWATAVLREKGVLAHGRVQTIIPEALPSQNSNMTRLRLIYSPAAPPDLPPSLMLKIVHTEPGEFGASEVDYYVRDYVDLPQAPLVPCYHAAYDGEHHVYHLLLADLTTTHQNNWQKPLTPAYGRALAEALAILHSRWWGTDRLQQTGIAWPYPQQIDRHLENVSRGLEPLLAETKEDIPEEWGTIIRQILEAHPRAMHTRMSQDPHFTLIHGDTNPGNILSPIQGETPLYLVDRQPFAWSFTHWLGVFDLAYLLGLWSEPPLRRQLEMDMLRHYHDMLRQQGVAGYSWAQLVADYKLCLLQQVYVPLAWCVNADDVQKMKWVWFPQLQRVMTAVSDLNCLPLINPYEDNHGRSHTYPI